ncbi:MAG: hypothetical protein KTR18_08410 [Acidiferrobacterales bacterium]|nr:hypothetical protein [Acidiferrobacterales bacterium]
MDHSYYLDIASQEGEKALNSNEEPAGAVLVKTGGDSPVVVAQSHNQTMELNDPIATAELDCIRRAGRRNDQPQLTLYTTRYPDMLCAGTLLQFSIGALVIGLPKMESAAIKLLEEKALPISFVPHQGCLRLSEFGESE